MLRRYPQTQRWILNSASPHTTRFLGVAACGPWDSPSPSRFALPCRRPGRPQGNCCSANSSRSVQPHCSGGDRGSSSQACARGQSLPAWELPGSSREELRKQGGCHSLCCPLTPPFLSPPTPRLGGTSLKLPSTPHSGTAPGTQWCRITEDREPKSCSGRF